MLISWFRSRRHHRTSRRLNKFRRRFLVEPLEGRQMLSTLYVTTAGDNGSNTTRWPARSSPKSSPPNLRRSRLHHHRLPDLWQRLARDRASNPPARDHQTGELERPVPERQHRHQPADPG